MPVALVNGHRTIGMDISVAPALLDGKEFSIDVAKLSDDKFHVIRDHKSYNAEIIDVNRQTKTIRVRINGSTYTVSLKEKVDLLLEKLGMNHGTAVLNNLEAPMPGLIIDLRVNAGQSVKEGDSLLVLEAMKMENIIKAAGDGVVKRVNIKRGDSVEKGQVLIEF